LRIVASQEITGIGTCTSDPAVVEWHWYYHVLPISPWALIALLLVVPKANRNRQAWWILIPAAALLAVWHAIAALLGVSVEAQQIGCLVMASIVGWSAVWLLGHWLGSRFKTLTLLSILAVMAAVGALSYLCCGQSSEPFPVPATLAMYYGLGVASVAGGMILAGRSCRKRFSGIRFGLWLLLWMGLITVALPMLVFLVWIVIAQDSSPRVVAGLVGIPIAGTMLAAIFYVFNLPFLILGMYSDFYRRRLEGMFRVRPIAEAVPLAAISDACIETERGSP
jgi:hypothetical protein